MSVQVESQSQLQEFLQVLRLRKWQIILPAASIIALGVAYAVIVPKKYVARTQVELRTVGVSISSKEGANATFQIRSTNRIRKVLKDCQRAEFLALSIDEQDAFITRVQADIKVVPITGSSQGGTFVNIEYMNVERAWAIEYLRALRQDWIVDVVNRDRNKAQDEERRLLDERNKLEKQLKGEEAKLTELRRENDLSATQPTPGSNNTRSEDPVFTRLKENEAAQKSVERELQVLQARLDVTQEQYDAMPAKLAREDLVAGQTNEIELRELELEIVTLEAKLQGIRPAFSGYQLISGQLEKKRERRDQIRRLVTKGQIETTTIDNPERAVLSKQIDAVKSEMAQKRAALVGLKADIETDTARVAQLQDVYSQEREYTDRISRIKEALAAASLEYQKQVRQVELLMSPLANPFEITAEVVADTKPTEPNPWLIVAFGVVAGLGLGLTLAVTAEFSKSCFRSVADITRVMVVPVLGAISPIATRRDRRLTLARRTTVGLASLVFIGAVLFVTWAWANDAQLLSQDLRDAIERLRTKMR